MKIVKKMQENLQCQTRNANYCDTFPEDKPFPCGSPKVLEWGIISFYGANKVENQAENENTAWKIQYHDTLAFTWSSKDISTTPKYCISLTVY